MPNRPALNDNEVREVFRIMRRNGQGPQVISGIAQQYHVTESIVQALGTIVTESDAKMKAITETAPLDATDVPVTDDRQQRMGQELADTANRAYTRGLHNASLQELEAVAATHWR